MTTYTTGNHYPYRAPSGYLRSAWSLYADAEIVGQIRETLTGYEGVLYGPGGKDAPPAYRTSVYPFRQSVIDALTRRHESDARVNELAERIVKVMTPHVGHTVVTNGWERTVKSADLDRQNIVFAFGGFAVDCTTCTTNLSQQWQPGAL